MTNDSENGFVPTERAKEVLYNSLKKSNRDFDGSVVDKIVDKCANKHGVNFCEVLEDIADFKTRENINRERTRKEVVRRFNDDLNIFSAKRDDTTQKHHS